MTFSTFFFFLINKSQKSVIVFLFYYLFPRMKMMIYITKDVEYIDYKSSNIEQVQVHTGTVR